MQTNQLTILTIDDSKNIRKTISDMLCTIKGVGSVKAAECAEEGLELAQIFKPRLIILDLSMGSTSGLDIIPKLKQIRPSPIVIILTNYTQSLYQQHCSQLGADFFLDKSLDFHKIIHLTKNLTNVIKSQTNSQ